MSEPNVVDLATRRRQRTESRLLSAARAALEVLDTMPLAELAEGGDSHVRAELIAAIREAETEGKTT